MKETNRLIGESLADPNPFQESKWLVPPRATTIEPPKERVGYAATWNEKKKNGKTKRTIKSLLFPTSNQPCTSSLVEFRQVF